jgi:hypothetical protein
VTGRRGRRRRKLLDDLEEGRGFSQWREEALDRAVWWARFRWGFGSVVRQTTKWMNEMNIIGLVRSRIFQWCFDVYVTSQVTLQLFKIYCKIANKDSKIPINKTLSFTPHFRKQLSERSHSTHLSNIDGIYCVMRYIRVYIYIYISATVLETGPVL